MSTRLTEIAGHHDRLRRASEQAASARSEYEAAILAAHDAGLSNVKIGAIVGVTETAIRQYIRRRRGPTR